MTPRIGLAIAPDAIRAVVVSGTAVRWAIEAPVERDADLAQVVTAVLRQAPVRRWPQPAVLVAVGPHASQVRRVGGLPALDDTRLLSGIIQDTVGAFFLKNGIPLVTTGIRVVTPGDVWAGTIDQPVVDLVRQACRDARCRVEGVAPTAALLPYAMTEDQLWWSDGSVAHVVTRRGNRLEALRTLPLSAASNQPPVTAATLPLPLRALPEHAERFLDAYAAAVAARQEPLLLRLNDRGGSTPLRRHASLFALAAAVGLLLLSPLGSRYAAWRAERAIAAVAPSQLALMQTALSELDSATRILTDVQRFDASRSGALALLHGLARVLPAGAVITELELVDGEVRLSVVGSDGPTLLAAVRRLAPASQLALDGSTNRQATPLGEMPAATLTLRWNSHARAALR